MSAESIGEYPCLTIVTRKVALRRQYKVMLAQGRSCIQIGVVLFIQVVVKERESVHRCLLRLLSVRPLPFVGDMMT